MLKKKKERSVAKYLAYLLLFCKYVTAEIQIRSQYCPTCSGDPYIFMASDAENCMYRYERSSEQFCFTENGLEATSSQQTPSEYFLVAGGITDDSTGLNSAVVYDSNWGIRALPDLPFSGDNIKGGVTGNRILICSAEHCYSWSSSDQNTWKYETESDHMTWATAVTTSQGVWFSGGIPTFNISEATFTQMITIDGSGSTTTKRRSIDLTFSRFYHCAIENGDSPILIGGIDLNGIYFPQAEIYNLPLDQVFQLPALNIGRTNHGCTKIRENTDDMTYTLVVAGGWHNADYTSAVEILKAGASTWTLVEPLEEYRLFTAMVSMHDKALLLGGGAIADSKWNYKTNIQVYNSTSGTFDETGFSLSDNIRAMEVIKIPASVI